MENLLKHTALLDYQHSVIQELIQQKQWQQLNDQQKIQMIYNFVRDDIQFGYNCRDDIPASQVLQDGYGQCNTKATLLMALLRAVHIPTRLHGFTIDKALQKGAIDGLWYQLSPANILHSWVEVYIQGQWFNLEGVILDRPYLQRLQSINKEVKNTFCGYGVYTENFQNPPIDWNLNHTYIQDKGINQDFGLFDSPDLFYQQHQQQLGYFKRLVFKYIIRHLMNQNVNMIRDGKSC
ncbi:MULTISPECIES: transglutaminase-like domain-containing protein [unclassified Acinetobacter]|uniref:transglutaminase-like domain-containing protein n=1 Tax=unclassified Acinetobacter TaxID=196816 RepID=UPI0029344EEE|nr:MULTISPECIES: transglutaminase-like domain-containing protein [unclassified Acinetobacter]WOE30846.1 transglutaminase-like domain-containing protein [Acinetobacter sp. SAAs470]WOE39041.1 transglutaminase-like domain-containing protein [Acinetobacter sp. SAAs474]